MVFDDLSSLAHYWHTKNFLKVVSFFFDSPMKHLAELVSPHNLNNSCAHLLEGGVWDYTNSHN